MCMSNINKCVEQNVASLVFHCSKLSEKPNGFPVRWNKKNRVVYEMTIILARGYLSYNYWNSTFEQINKLSVFLLLILCYSVTLMMYSVTNCTNNRASNYMNSIVNVDLSFPQFEYVSSFSLSICETFIKLFNLKFLFKISYIHCKWHNFKWQL